MCKKFIVVLLIIFLTPFICSCNSEIKKDADNLSNYLIENINSESIAVNDIFYDDTGVLIELYGSDRACDVVKALFVTNNWIEANSNSYIVNNNCEIAIEVYNERPDQWDRDSFNYVARLSNSSNDYNRDISTFIDCIDFNQCYDFRTSMLMDINDCRVIILPSVALIDNYEVFWNMNELEYLVVRVNKYSDDAAYAETNYQALIDYAGEHESDFRISRR